MTRRYTFIYQHPLHGEYKIEVEAASYVTAKGKINDFIGWSVPWEQLTKTVAYCDKLKGE